MPTIQAPTALGAFPSSTDRVWTLPFGLNWDPAILDPAALNYDLYVDTAQTFSSPNALHLTKTSASLTGFQEGAGIGKAFEVRLPGRSLTADVTWYWKLRINTGTFISDWTPVRSFVVKQRQDVAQTQEMFDNLADENSYDKANNSSNVYKLLLQIGRESDLLRLESAQAVSDLVIDTARDTALYGNFAAYLGLIQNGTETSSNYRWKIRTLWQAFTQKPGTLTGLVNTIEAFTAEPPVVIDITKSRGWILDQYFISAPSNPEIAPTIVIYDRPSMGHTFNLVIWNSWNLSFDTDVLENYIKKQKPAHAKMNLSYTTNRHWSARYNNLADWTAWTRDGNEDLSSYSGSVTIATGQTTTTLTSPILNIPTATAYDSPYITTTPSGQTVTVQYATSSDGVTFSSYVTLNHGVVPDSSISIQPYMKFRVTLTRTSVGAPRPILSLFEFRGIRS